MYRTVYCTWSSSFLPSKYNTIVSTAFRLSLMSSQVNLFFITQATGHYPMTRIIIMPHKLNVESLIHMQITIDRYSMRKNFIPTSFFIYHLYTHNTHTYIFHIRSHHESWTIEFLLISINFRLIHIYYRVYQNYSQIRSYVSLYL